MSCGVELLHWIKCWKFKMLYLVAFVITFLMAPGINAQSCTTGWFGENCMYQCGCGVNKSCGVNTGNCATGICDESSFGPGCQFYDCVKASSLSTTPLYLRDNNITTCNPNSTATFVEVKLKETYRFVWFRIEVKKTDNLLNFTAIINEKVQCSNEIRFSGNNFVDVWCDSGLRLLSLRITGPIAPNVCSIRVSAGRNVAVRQNATQSTTITPPPSGEASNAVDGNKDQHLESGSCSSTLVETRPWWRLTFTRPQIVNYIFIHNRNVNGDRLQGFTLQGFSAAGVKIFDYIDKRSASKLSYDVALDTQMPVKELLMMGKNTGPMDKRILAICEFSVLGANQYYVQLLETVCPKGTYGLWCSEKCQCKINELCSPITGLCAQGCNDGFHGLNCSMPCRSTCLSGMCRRVDGKCIECPLGFIGDFCDKVCPGGSFGKKCLSNCSTSCTITCNHITGNCSCKGNFAGPNCTDCAKGKHGENCTNQCPAMCLDQDCNRMSGECVTCPLERSGKFCEGCSFTHYGPGCSSNCSAFCANQSCDSVKGNCTECSEGYSGEKCDIRPTEHTTEKPMVEKMKSFIDQFWIFIVLILILIAAVIATLILCRRKSASHGTDEK